MILLKYFREQYCKIYGNKTSCWLYVALKLGVSYNTVSKWACGTRKIRKNEINKICKILTEWSI